MGDYIDPDAMSYYGDPADVGYDPEHSEPEPDRPRMDEPIPWMTQHYEERMPDV